LWTDSPSHRHPHPRPHHPAAADKPVYWGVLD